MVTIADRPFKFQCLGNHEFDLGPGPLKSFIDATTFPIVAANLNFSKEPLLLDTKVRPSVVLEVAGRKVGIIGYLTPNTKIMALDSNVIIDDEVEHVRRESEKLDEQGIDIIVALGHSGYKMDLNVAANVPLVDVVIGGHTDTFLWNGEKPDKEIPVDVYPKVVTQKSGKKVPVVQAYARTKYLGNLTVVFDEKGDLVQFHGQPIFLDERYAQDTEALDLLEDFRPKILSLDSTVIGSTKVYLDGDNCRFLECNFGNMVVDSFVYYKALQNDGEFWTDTAIAVINSGAIRVGINTTKTQGNITKGALLGAFPFQQKLVTVELKGADLKTMLETGVRSSGETSGGEFLQVSGLLVVADFSQPVGRRIMSVKVRCAECFVPRYEPLHLDRHYKIVVTAFLANGGDGHKVIRQKSLSFMQESIDDLEAVMRYTGSRKSIIPQIDERIIVLNEANVRSSARWTTVGGKCLVLVALGIMKTTF